MKTRSFRLLRAGSYIAAVEHLCLAFHGRAGVTCSAAQRLRTTMAAVKLAFTWLGVRKTLAPEQRTTAARAFQADRDLLSASKFILDLKHPAYRAGAAVGSDASGYWRTVTLPFPEAGIRLLPQNSQRRIGFLVCGQPKAGPAVTIVTVKRDP